MAKTSGSIMSKLTQLGYSMPGAVIAIGTITVFVALDGWLHPLYRFFDPNVIKLFLSSSITMLVFAFIVRYMALGFNSVNSAFAKIGVKYNDAARTLGMGKTKAMLKVELPMLKNSLIAGFILTFIDIIKELPLTLLLRPFNYNTLASRAYEYANDERIHEASVPALIIILLSTLAVLFLTRINARKGGLRKNETYNR
jgi:iron(III) transport system permease protein